MKVRMSIPDLDRTPSVLRVSETVERGLRERSVVSRELSRGPTDDSGLHDETSVIELLKVVEGNLGYATPAVGNVLDEAPTLELPDRFANWEVAHVERRRELFDAKALARSKRAGNDRIVKGLVCLFAQRTRPIRDARDPLVAGGGFVHIGARGHSQVARAVNLRKYSVVSADRFQQLGLGVERRELVTIITFDLEPTRNALSNAVLAAMADLMEEAQAGGSRCIVLVGSARVFAAGADLKELRDRSALDQYFGARYPSWDRIGLSGCRSSRQCGVIASAGGSS